MFSLGLGENNKTMFGRYSFQLGAGTLFFTASVLGIPPGTAISDDSK
jgi:hypothetical protein